MEYFLPIIINRDEYLKIKDNYDKNRFETILYTNKHLIFYPNSTDEIQQLDRNPDLYRRIYTQNDIIEKHLSNERLTHEQILFIKDFFIKFPQELQNIEDYALPETIIEIFDYSTNKASLIEYISLEIFEKLLISNRLDEMLQNITLPNPILDKVKFVAYKHDDMRLLDKISKEKWSDFVTEYYSDVFRNFPSHKFLMHYLYNSMHSTWYTMKVNEDSNEVSNEVHECFVCYDDKVELRLTSCCNHTICKRCLFKMNNTRCICGIIIKMK